MTAETAATELTVAEAAEFAGVSDRTIRNWINAGELAAINTPNGRKVRKDAVIETLREKGYAPPELGNIVILSDARAEREQGTASEPEVDRLDVIRSETPPTEPITHPSSSNHPSITPEMINVVMQPLVTQLNAAVERAEKKERENLELAGRVGYLQAKVQQYEEQVKLLEAPKESPQEPPDEVLRTMPPSGPYPDLIPANGGVRASQDHKAWYKRLFNLE